MLGESLNPSRVGRHSKGVLIQTLGTLCPGQGFDIPFWPTVARHPLEVLRERPLPPSARSLRARSSDPEGI